MSTGTILLMVLFGMCIGTLMELHKRRNSITKRLLTLLEWLAFYSPCTRRIVLRASDYGPPWWKDVCLDALYPDDAVVSFTEPQP